MYPSRRQGHASFFNLSLLSFCLRSAFKEYGSTFLLKVIVLHPLRTLKGVQKYSRSSALSPLTESEPFPNGLELKWTGGNGSIVGIGFCVKPLEPCCISGRANHDCYYLEHHLNLSQDLTPDPCKKCLVRDIGTAALSSKSDFYIMTSAKDILEDLFLPTINSKKYTTALLGLCQYSFEPFKMALSISGIEAFLFPFETGDCEDYRAWRKADKGIKDTQTQLRKLDLEKIDALLQTSEQNASLDLKYTKSGNIFQFDA